MHDIARRACLALCHLPGLSGGLRRRLLRHFGTAAALLAAPPASLQPWDPPLPLLAALRDWQAQGERSALAAAVARDLHWVAQPRQHLLLEGDPDFPELLRHIPDPPARLYLRGDLDSLARPQLALVGSRRPSPAGRRLARRFAAELGALGFVITSGMARGVDTESHVGALDAGAASVALLGSGVDLVYPAGQSRLAERIRAQGALVSEFALGAQPQAWHFPRRNRLISGLCLGVLVVEADLRSGSLITARLAGEQGREVFALPGSIDNPRSRGCHHLIRQGAKLVETVDDILEEIGPQLGLPLRHATPASRAPGLTGLTVCEARVLAELGQDRLSQDALQSATGLSPGELGAALTGLELRGLVDSWGGGYSRSAPEAGSSGH